MKITKLIAIGSIISYKIIYRIAKSNIKRKFVLKYHKCVNILEIRKYTNDSFKYTFLLFKKFKPTLDIIINIGVLF